MQKGQNLKCVITKTHSSTVFDSICLMRKRRPCLLGRRNVFSKSDCNIRCRTLKYFLVDKMLNACNILYASNNFEQFIDLYISRKNRRFL